MKFKDFLLEKFAAGMEAPVNANNEYIEVFENPSKSELKSIGSDGYRIGVTDRKNPKIYVWHGDVIHARVIENTKVKFNVNFWYEPKKTYFGSRPDTVTNDDNWGAGHFKDFEKIKYKAEILKKIQKIFPKVKYLRQYDRGIWFPSDPT